LAALFPIFKGQDESRHYNSIQYLNEPAEKNWNIIKKPSEPYSEDRKIKFYTYNFSEEIRKTAQSTNSEAVFTPEDYDRMNFSDGFLGKNENEITDKKWDPYNKIYPPDIAGKSLYHKTVALIDKALYRENILIRYFSIRIFSVFLGMLCILLAYLIAKNIGLTSKQSLLIAAIISFHPKFSIYLTNINYDAFLIPSFFAFTLAGVSILGKGLNWKNGLIISTSLMIALFTKGTGVILFPVFFGLIMFHSYEIKKSKRFKTYLASSTILLIVLFLIFNSQYKISGLISVSPYTNKSSSEIIVSLEKYLSKTFLKITSPHADYWGDIDWVRNDYSEHLINIIWFAQIVALIGLVMFLFRKHKPDFLPEKKYVVFLFGIWFVLQFGIRFFDWKYSLSDPDLDVGTSGRYFLPAITSHIILIFTGLGMILKKEKYLDIALKIGLILIFIFFMHVIFNTIIPQFYL